MSSLRFSSVPPSLVQPPAVGQFAMFLNSEDDDKAYIKDHLGNIKLFNNGDVSFTDIVLQATEPFVVSPPTAFVHTDYGSEVDIIAVGMTEITRGTSQSIYNAAMEGSYSSTSPAGTEWNSVYVDPTLGGFSDLSNIKNRTYGTFVDALDGAVGTNIFATELVMHDLSTDKYYAFIFSGWTPNALGGGFSYNRYEITIPEKHTLTFSDGSFMDTAPVMDVESLSPEITVVENIVHGKRIKTLSFAGGSSGVNYSNVIFVDPNGNDSTAVVGLFDKPYQNISTAINEASLMGASSSNKVLVYIRRGQYYWSGFLTNYVDIYCEAGVVFTGGSISDGAGAVVSNFLGYAVLLNTSIFVGNASTINFEFDYMSNNQSAGSISPSSGKAVVNLKANAIYAVGIGTGYAFTIRYDADVFFDIKRSIMSPHQAVSFRYYSGKCIINCPKIEITSGNTYGGNFKHAVVLYDSMTGSIIINGDLYNSDPVYYAGISAMLTVYGGGTLAGTFILNGDIYATLTRPINGNITAGGSMTINGSIYSDTFASWFYGNGKFLVRNGTIKIGSASTEGALLVINGTAELFVKNCYLYNELIDSKLIQFNSITCHVILDNTNGVAEGVAGYSIDSTAPSPLLYVTSSRLNKAINPIITDLYTPSGLIIDAITKVPKF